MLRDPPKAAANRSSLASGQTDRTPGPLSLAARWHERERVLSQWTHFTLFSWLSLYLSGGPKSIPFFWGWSLAK